MTRTGVRGWMRTGVRRRVRTGVRPGPGASSERAARRITVTPPWFDRVTIAAGPHPTGARRRRPAWPPSRPRTSADGAPAAPRRPAARRRRRRRRRLPGGRPAATLLAPASRRRRRWPRVVRRDGAGGRRARGRSLAAPERRPAVVPRLGHVRRSRSGPATRCGRSSSAPLARRRTRGPVVDELVRGPPTAQPLVPGRGRSGSPAAGPPRLRSRRRGARGGADAGRLPWRGALPVLRGRRRQGRRLAPADDGAAVRRRRECLACGRRFTTYERLEELPLMVVKRSGVMEPFDRAKLARRASSRRSPGGAVDAGAVEAHRRRDRGAGPGRRARGPSERSAWPCSSGCGRSTRSRTCGSPRSTRASRTSPTSSARSWSSRRPTAPEAPRRPMHADGLVRRVRVARKP